jgi:flagellar L-ring protein precursor FlgH
MQKSIAPLIASGLALALVHSASAQSVRSRPSESRDGDSQQPVRAASTQYLMQRSGGSLLQATDEAESSTGPDAAKPALSLIEVPEAAPHVLKKHDLVNIIVQEASKSESAGGAVYQRQVDFDAKVDAFVKLNLAKLSVLGGAEGAKPPEVKLEGQRDLTATGDYNRSDTVSLRLEAEVIDVKPNGTLVVQARRHIKTDEEDVSVSLTGICRVTDVDATNSVLSTDLHDLDLHKETRGAVRDTTNRSLIHRLLDFVNPF